MEDIKFVSADARNQAYEERKAKFEIANKYHQQMWDKDQLQQLSVWMNKTDWRYPQEGNEHGIVLFHVPLGFEEKLKSLNYDVTITPIARKLEQTTFQVPWNPHEFSRHAHKGKISIRRFDPVEGLTAQEMEGYTVWIYGRQHYVKVSVKGSELAECNI